MSFSRIHRQVTGLLFFLLSLLWLTCNRAGDEVADSGGPPGEFTPGATWLYQLQSADIAAILHSGFDRVVMDYSSDGEASGEYTAAQIQSLIDANIIPLAYLSIGEAENYRFYWDTSWVATEGTNEFTPQAPSWLGHTNPDWAGNYKVRYWDPDWRDNYLKPYLDRILAQGFMGVYLDIIDAFEYWSDPANYGGGDGETLRPGDPINDEPEAARRMIDLVEWIAAYARSHSRHGNDFRIFPQNGERILDYDDDSSYLNTVSGIGREDIWYEETRPKPEADVTEALGYLRQFVARGKEVLAVDYVDDGSGFQGANRQRILDFATRCQAEGFRYYIARSDRELDLINTITDVQP